MPLAKVGGKGGGTRVQASIAEILGLLGNTVVPEPVMGAGTVDVDQLR